MWPLYISNKILNENLYDNAKQEYNKKFKIKMPKFGGTKFHYKLRLIQVLPNV